jgi:hypothetical protein
VELAKKYSDNIIAADNAIDGEIRYNVSKNDPKNNDMVLCRITAPLVELHLNYIRINKKSYVRGNDNIKEKYLSLINTMNAEILDKDCHTTDGLFPKLYKYLLNEVERIKKVYELDDEDAINHPSIFTLYDTIEGIRIISEGTNTIGELIDKINVIFDGDEANAVQLSTIHKAKGLEADNVYILQPSLMPSKYAVKEWEKKAEKNLIYVAYTRAKKSLNFIKEDEKSWFNKNKAFEPDTMREKIDLIRARLNFNSKEEIGRKLQKPKILGEKSNTETENKNIGMIIAKDNKSGEVKRKKPAGLKFGFLK